MKRVFQKLSFALVCFIGLGLGSSFGQDTKTDNHTVSITIPEVAILDLELSTSKNLTMNFVAPTEAGNPITAPVNNTTLWLNYSSIVEPTGVDASRTVSVKTSALIPGVDIKVTAGADAGAGAGTKGVPVAAGVTLTTTDQNLITGVGSSWTDTGVSKGHQLTYAVSLTSAATYSSLVSGTSTVTVTYTLSAN
ncbi:hypothetical protein GVN16_16190 [Emticicia sp. CRIBPO]|uniref:hypothetical protein n=1 Tax=Emticicia sp. CRIBPO TaxID=2683258 RepID=UPI00141217CD|nr:hypothetical protein [Emticicia sp. CRIBPO]NBA87315.1 hypothetical protein [Emticicia sp. CRIBPO]